MVDSFGEKTRRDCDFQLFAQHDVQLKFLTSNRGEVCGRKSCKIWKKERATQLFKD
jgi:hypothetical protein